MWFIHLEIVIILGKKTALESLFRRIEHEMRRCWRGRGWLDARQRRKEVANRFGSQSIQLISREALPLYKRQKMLPLIFGREWWILENQHRRRQASLIWFGMWFLLSPFHSVALSLKRFRYFRFALQLVRNEGIDEPRQHARIGWWFQARRSIKLK